MGSEDSDPDRPDLFFQTPEEETDPMFVPLFPSQAMAQKLHLVSQVHVHLLDSAIFESGIFFPRQDLSEPLPFLNQPPGRRIRVQFPLANALDELVQLPLLHLAQEPLHQLLL